MLIPVLPDIQRTVNISKGEAGLIITALSVPTGLLLPLSGILSDRYGRKPIMVPAIILYGLGGAVAALFGRLFVAPYGGILLGRVIQGIGASGMTLVAMSFTADMFQAQERARALGILEASNSFGKLVSPLLGGITVTLIWYAPFLVYPVLSVLVAIAVVISVGNPPLEEVGSKSLREYFQQLMIAIKSQSGRIIGSFLVTITTVILWFGGLFAASQILEELHVGPRQRGLLLAIPVVALTVTSLISSRYIGEKGFPLAITTGLLSMAAGHVGLGYLESVKLVVVALSGGGLAMGLVLPALNSIITGCVSEEQRGIVTTTYGSLRAFGSAFGPPLFGYLMGVSGEAVFLAAAGLALVGAGMTLIWLRRIL